MHRFSLQPKNILIKLLGYLVFPGWLIGMMFAKGILRYNFTGLLNDTETAFASHMYCLSAGLFLLYLLKGLLKRVQAEKIPLRLLTMAVCFTCTVLIPYTENGTLSSQVHILAALLSLFVFVRNLIPLKDLNRSCSTIFLCAGMTSAAVIITYASVTGLSEILLTVPLCYLLTYLYTEKNR